MIPTKTIQLDFWRHPTDILHLVQGEADGRKIQFKITDNGSVADLTGFIAIFAIRKPDGNVVVNSATITEAELGIVETTISSQVVTTAGNAHAELHLMKEGQLSKSFRIVTKVAPGVDIDGIAPSVSEFNALQTLIGQAETVISIADTELWPEVVENAQYFSDLAGAGRTVETVKGNADDIADLAGAGRNTETVKGNADEIALKADADDLTDLAGVGRTNQTVKANADAITNLAGDGRNTETVKANADAITNLAGTGRTTETVKKNADDIANRARTLNNGAEQTVADKNKYYPLLSNVAGTLVATHQTNVWTGSAWQASYSYGFGNSALLNNTGPASNGFGYSALSNNTGTYSSGFGYNALSNNTGASSNGFGYNALSNNTGTYSNGFGHNALLNNTGAVSNGFGNSALLNNTGARANGFGYSALSNNTGTYSSGFGPSAMSFNTGEYSNGFGYNALLNNTGAVSNGFGNNALRYNQSPKNTAIGDSAYSAFLTNAAGAKTCADTDINITDERATITAHGFGATNAIVLLKYTATTGAAIGGLALDTIFQAKIIDANTIEFVNGSTKRNLTSAGTGTHTFTPQFAYENTTCLGASTVPNKSNQVVLGDTSVDTVKMGGTARTPASATDTGVKGEMCWDANYIYVCVATNTWKRSALSTW